MADHSQDELSKSPQDQQEALKESEQRFKDLANSLPEMVLEVDTRGVLTYANDKIMQYFDLTPADISRGVSVFEYILPAQRDSAMFNLKKVLQASDVGSNEYTLVKKDGTAFPSLIHTRRFLRGDVVVGARGIAIDITQQKLTQIKYETLLDRAMDGYYLVDLQGRFREVNDSYCQMVGYNREELLKMSISDVEAAETAQETAAHIRRILEKGRDRFETKQRRKDGRILVVEASVNYVDIEGGRLVVFLADISQRKKDEDSLKESEQKYRSLFQNMTEGFAYCEIILDAGGRPVDFRFIELNNAWETMTGLPVAQSQNHKASEIFRGLEAYWIEAYGKVALSGADVHIENYNASTARWYDVYAYSPRKGFFVALFRDVTRRKQGEQFLNDLNEKEKILNEASLKVIAETKIDSALAQVAEAARSITKAQIAICGHAVINGQFQTGGASCVEGYPTCPPGKEFHFERGGVYMDLVQSRNSIRISRADLQKHPSWWGLPEGHAPLQGLLGARLFDKQGKANGLIMVSDKIGGGDFDNSDEDYLLRLAALASLTVERILARLEAEKRALETETANKELEQFAYVASHDLREPLRMITSFAQLLEKRYKDKLDTNANEYIGFIVDGSARMQNLIDDLLVYSRVGTRGKPFEATEMEAVLKDVMANLKVAIEESKARITHDPLPMIQVDATQIAQVLQNLISNAIKFRRDEPPVIHISAVRGIKEWVFSVRDNGIGIDPQLFDKLFVLFQRLQPRDKYPGTGIGLAVAKKVVQRHGGRIWVESAPGKGSTFFFTLPLRSGKETHD